MGGFRGVLAMAFIRRAVFSRLMVGWAAAEGRTIAGGYTNALVKEMIDKTSRFRRQHLAETAEGRLCGELGNLLHQLAPDLAEAVHQDEDFAGLLDRAFGNWLVQPTLFDMIEYRISNQEVLAATQALQRFSSKRELPQDLRWLEKILPRFTDVSVRELLKFTTKALV
jgi:hypothetical protein